jgi:hypothetical protein
LQLSENVPLCFSQFDSFLLNNSAVYGRENVCCLESDSMKYYRSVIYGASAASGVAGHAGAGSVTFQVGEAIEHETRAIARRSDAVMDAPRGNGIALGDHAAASASR